MSTDPAVVTRLAEKLDKWRGKREARGLDSLELRDAIRFLREYAVVLAAAETVNQIYEGGQRGTP